MLEKIDLWFSCFPVDNKRIDGLGHELHQLQRRGFVKIDVFFSFLVLLFVRIRGLGGALLVRFVSWFHACLCMFYFMRF